ncbi:hypothetical protein HJB56_28740 [Rhizobium lentis]|uniref:hypothetical protein n=1 Tax=Rhizobium lentis TaxID=1138194 RepID=UPI001C829731|nr:hypothetical protein [Rhizobium lentis]MBX4959879.1 hypothetical protein [Rhizobium lentis]MBX4977814.1 hypothetical protein [Rhizobium lentis]MBX4989875.1 hypothetical protein [Rhizobium lentis]MBX5008317.1 hypothetical protein [Rhizobium lentis]MBX5032911.1 hypothetical protein [Rhizobium lentis]
MHHTLGVKQAFTIFSSWHRITEPPRFCLGSALGAHRCRILRAGFWPELHLNAFLLAKGHEPKKIRGLQHDIGEGSQWAKDAGLILRKRTEAHLATLKREYLVTRYDPAAPLSPENQVMATLEELSQKVRKAIDGSLY